MSEIIRTVLGDIEPEMAGPTAPHEHLIIDLRRPLKETASDKDRDLQNVEISIENYYPIRRGNFNHFDRTLDDVDIAVDEIAEFYDAGGRTIVDATSVGLGRDPQALKEISRRSSVNVVMGSGYYVREFQNERTRSSAVGALTDRIVQDVTEGADNTDIRAGLIGEIGMTSPWSTWDETSLSAALEAQKQTGAPLMVHPGRQAGELRLYLDLIEKAGVAPNRVCISHIDRTLFKTDELVQLAKSGVYFAFDLFGQEFSFYAFSDIDMPNDAQRVMHIAELAHAGYVNQILMSQDIYRKTCLSRWGGEGYGHILKRVVPLMRRRGFTHEEIEQLIVHNPREFLSFYPESP